MYRFKANISRFDALASGMHDELVLLTKDVVKKFPHYRIYQRLDRPSEQFRLYIDHKEKAAVNIKDLVQICGHYERFFKKYYKTAVKLPLLIVDTEWKKCVSSPLLTQSSFNPLRFPRLRGTETPRGGISNTTKGRKRRGKTLDFI